MIVGEPGDDGEGQPDVAVDVLSMVSDEQADDAYIEPNSEPLSDDQDEHSLCM